MKSLILFASMMLLTLNVYSQTFTIDEKGIVKCAGANPGDKGTIDGVTYEAVDRDLLIQRRDEDADLTKVCTSLVTQMGSMFLRKTNFNQDISSWDVSNVTDMDCMFCAAYSFNQPIGNWDVSNVTDMQSMFEYAVSFNQNINNWDVSNVTKMDQMFWNAFYFNQPIGNWDVSNVVSMSEMFDNAQRFNQDLSNWDVSSVTTMAEMFWEATSFNKSLNDWDVSSVTTMGGMFGKASSFNQPLDKWDVGNVESMSVMFYGAVAFNQDINNWDVANVRSMSGMFSGYTFVDYLSGGEEGRDEIVRTQFNMPLNSWNTSSVLSMDRMFSFSEFNQHLDQWDVSNVRDMSYMFSMSPFNRPLSNWIVKNVTKMDGMFSNIYIGRSGGISQNSSINQDLSSWCVRNIPQKPNYFDDGASNWTKPKPEWGTCPSISDDLSTVTDIDGKVYNTVLIGTQLWMESNLRVSRFNDGTAIPQITLDNPTAWSTNDTGAWSYYNDDVDNNALFGKLYNFYVVSNDKNVCPTGWEVPSDDAWTQLMNFLGANAGQKMKSTSGWRDGGNGNNQSGFNAVPAGRKGVTGTAYTEIGQAARFWSSTENNQNNAWIYRLTYDSNELQRDYNQMGNGFSIRCIYSEPILAAELPEVQTNQPEDVTSSTARLRGRILSDGNDTIVESGFCVGTSNNPDHDDTCVTNTVQTGNYNYEITGLVPETTYYVRAYAENSVGKSYGASRSFTTSRFVCGDGYSDIDGKVYDTVQIGDQCWMSQNLRVSRFNDGTVIPEITLSNPVAWSTNDTGAWSFYDDNEDNNSPYGKLYNFYVVDNDKNVCPLGWKVPTDQEWGVLSTFLGANAGRKMKSISGWRDSGNGTNESGFNVFPAGRKGVTGTAYTEILMAARFWTSTENNQNNGWIYRLTYNSDELQRDYNQKGNGFSIRCMLDPTSPVSIEEAKIEVPTSIELHQNYPNPFNPTTKIRFALPESQQVSIQVYDVNGRLVASLLNSATYSAGEHQVSFDGSGLSSGIYIYTMTTSGGASFTRKLLLIK